MSEYNEEEIDTDFEILRAIAKEFSNLAPIRTMNNGNCLYNAVSLDLFANENYAEVLRILVIFIYFEHDRIVIVKVKIFLG